MLRLWIVICGTVLLACCQNGEETPVSSGSTTGELLELPVDVAKTFVPARWGETDSTEVLLEFEGEGRPGGDGTCIRIEYHPADEYWAAVFWQPKKELGVRRPVRLPPGAKVTFWAKGETGRESVEFKRPGDPSHELLATGEPIRLGTEWKRFELEVGDRSDQPMAGIFGVRWECTEARNPGGLSFFLDDLRIEPGAVSPSD